MTPADAPEFERLLRELFSAYRQAPPDDAMLQGFGKSLSRLSILEFSRIQALMLSELEFADPPKYLSPRHVWDANKRLRSQRGDVTARPRSIHQVLLDLADRDPERNAALRAAFSLNEQAWREFGERDPQLQALEYGIAQCGLILARDPLDSPQYAEAKREDWKFREERRRLLEARRREHPAEKVAA